MIYNISTKFFKNIAKSLLIITAMFVLTGCDIFYEVNLTDVGNDETVKLIEDDNNDNDDSMDRYIDYLENYDEYNLPLSIKDGARLEKTARKKGVSYYEISRFDDYIGLQFTGHFNKNENISNSNLINYVAKNGVIVDDDLSIKIDLSMEKLFKNIPRLNSITIDINAGDYKVKNNNADEVNNNTYTWNYTIDNYQDKSIIFEASKINSITDADKITSYALKNTSKNAKKIYNNISNKEIIIICLFLIIFSYLIYKHINAKKIKNNKF